MLNLMLLLVSLAALVGYFYYRFRQDIVAPPMVMAVMFLVSTICAAINAVAWKIDYSLFAYLYIVSGIVVFTIPSMYYHRQPVSVSYQTSDRYIGISSWKIVLTLLVNGLLVLLFWLEMYRVVRAAGYTQDNIQWAFRELTSYRSQVQAHVFVRVFSRILDVSAYLFGYTFIHNKLLYKHSTKKDWLLLGAPALFAMKTILSGGRLDLLKLGAAYILMAYILQKRKVGWDKNIAGSYMKLAISGIVIGLPAFYYTLFLTGRSTSRTIWQSVSTYLGGSIQHFNQYVQHPVPHQGILGEESFIAILNLLGKLRLIRYHETVHLEYRKLGVTSGNVYTFFRRPLHDFGPAGMYLFVILVGVFFAVYYYRYLQHKKPSFVLDVQTVVYGYFFYWVFLSSIEQYSFSAVSVFSLVFIFWAIGLAIFYWKVEIDWQRKKIVWLSEPPVQAERNSYYD